MPNKLNIANLEKITEEISNASAIWVIEYAREKGGMTVKEMEALRAVVRETGSKMAVQKNTLVRIACEQAGLPDMGSILEGPSAFIYAGADAAASAKAIKEFAAKNSKVIIKGGLMDGQVLSAEQVIAVASLPSREQLYAQIAGAISGVARGLAVTINGVTSGMARAIQQVADQKNAA